MKRTSTRKQERAAFKDMLARIESIEQDKDAFLKAARLSRQEREPRLTGEQICCLAGGAMFLVGFLGFFLIFIR